MTETQPIEIRQAGPPTAKCWKCTRQAEGRDAYIGENRIRVDCEHCGYFLRWGRWHAENRQQTKEST